jgi:predicted HTH transcriptional regulator
VIGQVFKELGLLEQWGSGIRRTIDTCREYGLPAPEMQEIGTHFRVTFNLSCEFRNAACAVNAHGIKLLAGAGGPAMDRQVSNQT